MHLGSGLESLHAIWEVKLDFHHVPLKALSSLALPRQMATEKQVAANLIPSHPQREHK